MKPRPPRWQSALFLAGVLLLALNLRPAITAVAPLAERIEASGVPTQVVGLLTTIPVLIFGFASLLVSGIGARIGFARALGLGLFLLVVGCLLRSAGNADMTSAKVAGSILIGCGIAFGMFCSLPW